MTETAIKAAAETPAELEEQDLARASLFSLLGSLLAGAPERETLVQLGQIDIPDADNAPLAAGWRALALAAREAIPTALVQEYSDLFVGLGRGEVVPYGSVYLTGFLMERPLAELRRDLATLGIERSTDNAEPEDHIATLCQCMALLIAGDPASGSPPMSLPEQQAFFTAHLRPWAPRFFDDLASAPSASFYAGVAQLGQQFLAVECQYLDMPA